MLEPRTRGRLIIVAPVHPVLLALYTFAALIIVLPTWDEVVSPLLRFGAPAYLLALTVRLLLALSPLASMVNIVVAVRRLGQSIVPAGRIVYVYGIPIVIPGLRVVERKSIIAVNVGGALIPILVGVASLVSSYSVLGSRALEAALYSTIVTALVTFLFSRAVPGVGIVVPALIPPLVAAGSVILQVGLGPAAAGVAYFSGTLGSLIGADVLRLFKDLKKLDAPFLSIGGAGVFDGVYLSGVLAALLAL